MAALRLLPLLFTACALWDGAPYRENVTGLTDADGDGWTLADADCNDADPDVHPYATEVCDGIDNDCNGQVDEVPPDTVWCPDVDRDGYGDGRRPVRSCNPEPGWVLDCTDCDDWSRLVHPGALEICNGVDDDCDGAIDPIGSEGAPEWYTDADGDGYGSDHVAVRACEQPPHTAAGSGDCNDLIAAMNPGMVEICEDGLDNDCDGTRNGCGWSGAEVLDTSFASFIAGPEAAREYWGAEVGFVDVDLDGVDDVAVSGYGAMYGDDSSGALHILYGSGASTGTVDEFDAHVVGVEDLWMLPTSGPPVVPIVDPATGAPLLLLPTSGLAEELGYDGVVLAAEPGPSGTISARDLEVFGLGRSYEESYGNGVVPMGDDWGVEGALAVSAYANADRGAYNGAVYIVSSRAPDAADAQAVIYGIDRSFFGAEALGVADLDGDGVTDIAADGGSSKGDAIVVFHGPLSGEQRSDEADLAYGGDAEVSSSVAGDVLVLPDVDGDGLPDLAARYLGSLDPTVERVYLLAGVGVGRVVVEDGALGYVYSEESVVRFGYGLATDDFYADGVPDLVIGAPEMDIPRELGGGEAVGAVAVVPLDQDLSGGVALRDAASVVFYSPDKDSYTGYRIATGDPNHDGFPDLLVSSSHWEGNGYVLSGGVWFLQGGGI